MIARADAVRARARVLKDQIALQMMQPQIMSSLRRDQCNASALQ